MSGNVRKYKIKSDINSAANQLGLGGGIGGGIGYALSNRLKNPNFTRHALMSVTFSIFGYNVVQFAGIKVRNRSPVDFRSFVDT